MRVITTSQATKLNGRINLIRRAKKETLRLLEKWLPEDEISRKLSAFFDDFLTPLESQLQEFQLASKTSQMNPLGYCKNTGKDFISSRLRLGWSHTFLAERANTTRHQISLYERSDYQNATLKRLIEIEAALLEGFKELEDFDREFRQMERFREMEKLE